jgi:hypothetical protein
MTTEHDVQLSSWKSSQNSSEYCRLSDLPDDIRSQLQQEDKYTNTIDGFRYTVKDYEGKWLVFRRTVARIAQANHYMVHANNIHEIKLMSLDEANDYLQNKNQEYRILGDNPVKIINNEAYVVMAKYAQQSTTMGSE